MPGRLFLTTGSKIWENLQREVVARGHVSSGYENCDIWHIVVGATFWYTVRIGRIKYFFYGEETTTGAAIFLLLTRIVFIEILSWLDQFKYTPFLYLIVLFLACLYFGELVGYCLAALAWVVYFVKHMYYGPDWLSDGTELHYLILFTVGIVLDIARQFNRSIREKNHCQHAGNT